MVSIVITLSVVIISVAAIMMPVINDVKETAGAEVTYSNVPDSYEFPYYAYYTEDMTIVLQNGDSDTTNANLAITVNDESVTMPSSWNAIHLIVSDSIVIDLTRSGGTAAGQAYYFVDDVYTNTALGLGTNTIEYDASEKTLTLTTAASETVTVTVTEAVGPTAGTSGFVTFTSNNYSDAYVTQAGMDDGSIGIYEYNGTVTVGDNSVYVLAVTQDGDVAYKVVPVDSTNTLTYTVSLVVTGLELVDGTTDIYTGGTPGFVITDSDGTESSTLTPIKSLVIDEVTGHEASGAAYSLYGAIPALVLVSLIVAATGLITINKRD